MPRPKSLATDLHWKSVGLVEIRTFWNAHIMHDCHISIHEHCGSQIQWHCETTNSVNWYPQGVHVGEQPPYLLLPKNWSNTMHIIWFKIFLIQSNYIPTYFGGSHHWNMMECHLTVQKIFNYFMSIVLDQFLDSKFIHIHSTSNIIKCTSVVW